ncbi:hypothetical protein [Roseobacter sp. AzwK-3b]|uniref:hypothetical protein n=1 Tax=Roseobacter sp. AzwK-3b TaxID=351016 RepID=UPI0012F4C7B7|nr:hypothetical protein [Roseobacter sp. AzwK-3b]
MRTRLLALSVLSILCSTATAHAQDLDVLISDCLSAIEKDEQAADAAADAIIGSGSISDPYDREGAIECVKAVKGEQWSYSVALGGFLSAEQLAAAKRQAELQLEINFARERVEKTIRRATEAFNTTNREMLAEETYQSCAELYSKDKSEALLNGTCQKAFLEVQHPNMPDRTRYILSFIEGEYPEITEAERIAVEQLSLSGQPAKHTSRNNMKGASEAASSLSSVQQCWNVGSLNDDALRSTISVEFEVDETFTPKASTFKLLNSNAPTEAAERQAFEAARKAVIRCGVNGYKEAEAGGKAVITFNAKRMRVSFEVEK